MATPRPQPQQQTPRPATNLPRPGSLPKLPPTIFNVEKRSGNGSGTKRGRRLRSE